MRTRQIQRRPRRKITHRNSRYSYGGDISTNEKQIFSTGKPPTSKSANRIQCPPGKSFNPTAGRCTNREELFSASKTAIGHTSKSILHFREGGRIRPRPKNIYRSGRK